MKRELPAAVALLGLAVVLPLSRAGAAPASRTTEPVTLKSDASAAVGSSTLTRTPSGVSFSLQTTRLSPGHAVTVWWMVANPDGGMAVLYAAGHVIDDSGTAEFGGSLKAGDSDGLVMGDDTSMEDVLGATVSLVVRDHGEADPATVNDQVHTFAACNSVCQDLQLSVHSPS